MRFKIISAVCLCLLSGMSLFADSPTIRVSNAWVNEAPPTVNINAAYLSIENTTDQIIILNEIESPDFERIEIHRSIVSDDTARMQLQTLVNIAANAQFRFAPGGYHLMLFNPGKPLHAGDMTSFTLHFSGEIQITVDAEIKRLKLDHSHQH